MATHQAQEILDNATMEANNVRAAAMQYTDGILANVDNLLNQTMKVTQDHFESFMGAMTHYSDTVNANRVELNPPEADEFLAEAPPDVPQSDNLNADML